MNGVETTICCKKEFVGRIDQNMGRNDQKVSNRLGVEMTGCRNDWVPLWQISNRSNSD